LRLGFYTSDIFAPEPTQERDAKPMLDMLKKYKPDYLTVALDPEASGPDTHYKVLQAVTAAAASYVEECDDDSAQKMKVWGYRNVWYRFGTHETDLMVPVTLNDISALDDMFLSCFETQRAAEFPSPELNGPFSDLSRMVQCEQYQVLKTCLGREWFQEHEVALVRSARGFVFLKEMDVNGLMEHSRQIREHNQVQAPKSPLIRHARQNASADGFAPQERIDSREGRTFIPSNN
jgi:glucosamine-6-phosphate deaminase